MQAVKKCIHGPSGGCPGAPLKHPCRPLRILMQYESGWYNPGGFHDTNV